MTDVLDLMGAGAGSYDDVVPDREEIGPVDYASGIPVAQDRSGDVVRIPLTATTRIGLFGPSGVGKTLLAKALLSRAYDDGYKIFHGSDVKNDFQKVNGYGGVSKQLINECGLLPGENPREMQRVLAIPNFMVEHYQADPRYGTRFALSFEDITLTDFKFLLGYDQFSPSQKDLFDVVMGEIEFTETNLNHLISVFESQDSRSARPIARKLKALQQDRLLDNRMWKDVFTGNDGHNLQETGCLSLGLRYWEQYFNGDMHKLQFYSGIMHRNLVDAIQSGELDGPLVIFNDEFHKLAADGQDSLVKDEFQNILDLSGRQADVSTCISAQRPSQVPYPQSDDAYDFLGTLNYLFLGFNLARQDWKTALQATPIWDGNYSHRWAKRIRQLRKYEFLMVDVERHRRPRDCPIVSSLAPLCHHGG